MVYLPANTLAGNLWFKKTTLHPSIRSFAHLLNMVVKILICAADYTIARLVIFDEAADSVLSIGLWSITLVNIIFATWRKYVTILILMAFDLLTTETI